MKKKIYLSAALLCLILPFIAEGAGAAAKVYKCDGANAAANNKCDETKTVAWIEAFTQWETAGLPNSTSDISYEEQGLVFKYTYHKGLVDYKSKVKASLIQSYAIGKKVWIKQEISGIRVETKQGDKSFTAYVRKKDLFAVFSSEDQAKRVVKALNHLATLAKGKQNDFDKKSNFKLNNISNIF